MLSAGSGYRGSGFLLRLLPGLHRTVPGTNGFAGGFFFPFHRLACPGVTPVRGRLGAWASQGAAPGDPSPSPAPGLASAPFGATGPTLFCSTFNSSSWVFPTRSRARRVFPTQLKGDFHFGGELLPITTKHATNPSLWASMPVPSRLPRLQDGAR